MENIYIYVLPKIWYNQYWKKYEDLLDYLVYDHKNVAGFC